uniref:Uncharacterized protein n=1 Tax=Arundo donax TaxID=35708 RepID=A0A0A9GDM1_ARUDO
MFQSKCPLQSAEGMCTHVPSISCFPANLELSCQSHQESMS